jgi:tubulin--tyrosine ligase
MVRNLCVSIYSSAGADSGLSVGPPSVDESPFIMTFVEHLESLGWEVRFGFNLSVTDVRYDLSQLKHIFPSVCLPDSQKSWISKSFMIKDHIGVKYYSRQGDRVQSHKSAPNDFVLVIHFDHLLAKPLACGSHNGL